MRLEWPLGLAIGASVSHYSKSIVSFSGFHLSVAYQKMPNTAGSGTATLRELEGNCDWCGDECHANSEVGVWAHVQRNT